MRYSTKLIAAAKNDPSNLLSKIQGEVRIRLQTFHGSENVAIYKVEGYGQITLC